MRNRDHCLGRGQSLWQRCVHGQHAVLAQGGPNRLRVDSLRQQELPVVLTVHALRVRLLLVLGVHQQFLVHSLHDDLLGRILAHVEAQLEYLAVSLVLDQGRANVRCVVGPRTLLRQGCVVVAVVRQAVVVARGGRGAAESKGRLENRINSVDK